MLVSPQVGGPGSKPPRVGGQSLSFTGGRLFESLPPGSQPPSFSPTGSQLPEFLPDGDQSFLLVRGYSLSSNRG